MEKERKVGDEVTDRNGDTRTLLLINLTGSKLLTHTLPKAHGCGFGEWIRNLEYPTTGVI